MTETDASVGEVPITIIITSDFLCLQRLKGQHDSPETKRKKVCARRSAGAYESSRTENDDLTPPHMLASQHFYCRHPLLTVQSSFTFPGPSHFWLDHELGDSCVWSHQWRESSYLVLLGVSCLWRPVKP